MLSDESLMPIGKYKGRKMVDVPAQYLLFLIDEDKIQNGTEVAQYIWANLETLRMEAINEKKGIYGVRPNN